MSDTTPAGPGAVEQWLKTWDTSDQDNGHLAAWLAIRDFARAHDAEDAELRKRLEAELLGVYRERAALRDALRECAEALEAIEAHWELHERSDYPTRYCTDCTDVYHRKSGAALARVRALTEEAT